MKRTLVVYDSSDEDACDEKLDPQEEVPVAATTATIVKPRRKLPKLSSSLVPPPPTPDPLKHQGRVRTTPHVEGQFATYVYIPIPLTGEGRKLAQLLTRTVNYARGLVGKDVLKCDWLQESDENVRSPLQVKDDAELHVSLTRPIYLRAHQREELKKVVRDAVATQAPFTLSMASFATFENDERTRAFVGVEVGAGHSEMMALSTLLSESLQSLRQQIFYSEPRFHASFAWALLDRSRTLAQEVIGAGSSSKHPEDDIQTDRQLNAARVFHTIPFLPPALSDELNSRFRDDLLDTAGVFEVNEIRARIGRNTFRWKLGPRESACTV